MFPGLEQQFDIAARMIHPSGAGAHMFECLQSGASSAPKFYDETGEPDNSGRGNG